MMAIIGKIAVMIFAILVGLPVIYHLIGYLFYTVTGGSMLNETVNYVISLTIVLCGGFGWLWKKL